jgi:hypothetical protein
MRARMLFTTLALTWCSLFSPSAGMADVAGHTRLALATPSSFANVATTAKRSSYVVLQAWDGARAAQLKAANPSLTVLMYQNTSAMTKGAGPNGIYSSGVGYEQADTAHPDWFLKDTAGKRIVEGSYDWVYMADLGNAAYQDAWAKTVIDRLNSGPWDGVFMDDVNTTAMYHTDSSKIALYPNDSAYQAATRSMLAAVGPRLRAAGKLAIPNIGSWSGYPDVAKDWLQFVDGGMDEMFAKWSTTPGVGYRPAIDWKTQVEEIRAAESMGKRFLAVTQAGGGDAQAERYGWATVLMAAKSTNTSYVAATNYNSEPDWLPEYDAHIGDPTGAATALGNGAYARTFSNGLVVVNPSASDAKVAFGGAYSGSGLTNATSATLAPNTALVLTKGDQASVGPIVEPGSPSAVGGAPASDPQPSSDDGAPAGGTQTAGTSPTTVVTTTKPVSTAKRPPVKKATKKPAAKRKTARARAARLAKKRKARAARAKASRVKAHKKTAVARARAARRA